MIWLRIFLHRLAGLFLKSRLERELQEEIDSHLEMQIEENMQRGMNASEARYAALRQFGRVEQIKERYRAGSRLQLIESIFQDLRFALRMLIKQPSFTAVAILAIGLGIGVNTAILSAVNGFILRPLPVDRPAELQALYWGRKIDHQVWDRFSYANYLDLREQNRSFQNLCVWSQISAAISAGEGGTGGERERAEVVWGELVSSNYFSVMGVKPILGRDFLPAEDRTANTDPVVVLSHSLWQRRFKADPMIVGQQVYLNGQPFTVIGVMPEPFLGSVFYLRQAFWTPTMMAQRFGRRADWQTDRSYKLFNVYGRLKPGITLAQAETDLNLVSANLANLYAKENGDTRIQLTTELDGRYADGTRVIKYCGLLALIVSGLVLLLACANVANLLLARAASRAREIGIRLAIGAGRARIIRQLLTESLLLALLGGALGWLFAYPGTYLIQTTFPPVPYPIAIDFAPDGYVLKSMLAISLITGVLFGLMPAWLSTRTDLVAVIKGEALKPTHQRRRWNLRSVLVVAQVSISIIVLICAGLFIRNLGNVRHTDPGFQTENLVTMMISPGLLNYDPPTSRRFYRELQRRIEAQPGVRMAALASELPLMDSRGSRGPIVREGEPDPQPNQGVISECSFVTPKYFDTLRTLLVLGRDFTERDDADGPSVVIVNQEFARRFYGSEQNALGKRFRFATGTPLMEIVGIARDGHYGNLYEDQQIYLFLPVYQHPQRGMTLLISLFSPGAISAVTESVRGQIAQLDAGMPVYGVMIAEDNIAVAYMGPRIAAGTATTFGLLALVLAMMGLYSVMTYAVSQRTREIGIRMALGANLRDVLRLVVRQGMRMALFGIGLGLVVALALTRVLASLLLGVGTTDALTFIGVTVLLIAVALLACYIPARRATRVNPLVALRHE